MTAASTSAPDALAGTFGGLFGTTAAEAAPLESLATEVLEVLLERDHLGASVALDEVAARLPVPPTDVGSTIEGLVARGVLRADGDQLSLTPDGHDLAVTAVRRHRLAERLLSDVIGLEWWKVHHEAVRFEGAISADVEAALVELLGDPGTCPHGNPIPGSPNQPDQSAATRLADAPIGPVRVVRITETLEGDDEALQLLQGCGFVPGRDAEVKERRDGWTEVAGTVRDAALPPHVAAHTYVAPLTIDEG